MIFGLAMGMFYSWKVSLIVLAMTPLLSIGAALEQKYGNYTAGAGKTEKTAALKEADLMGGDLINNFKTIASFGHIDRIIEKYQVVLEPVFNSACSSAFKSAFFFGFSQGS